MRSERRTALRRTYLSLGLGELAAAIVFLALAAGVVTPRHSGHGGAMALWFALIPLVIVLVQAGVYWLLARTWVGRTPMPRSVAEAYRFFRFFDIGCLLIGFAGAMAWFPDSIALACAALAVWLFGVIEYVNYFVVRLSYPLAQWPSRVGQWHKPRLIRDLESSRR